MGKLTYYSGHTKLSSVFALDLPKFRAIGGTPNKHNRFDSFKRMAGMPADKSAVYPVTRWVRFKINPSLHKCDARCRNAKGHDCECSCGGEFHGAGY